MAAPLFTHQKYSLTDEKEWQSWKMSGSCFMTCPLCDTRWILSTVRIYNCAHTFVTVVMATLPFKFSGGDTAGIRQDSIVHSGITLTQN